MSGTLHLWCLDGSLFHSELDSLCCCLNEAERERAAGYKFELPRVRFQVARSLLRYTLAHYLHIDAKQVQFGLTANEKPIVLHEQALQFNISHTADMVVIALASDRSVGVDVEKIEDRRNMLAIAKHYFHEREVALIADAQSDRQIPLFYRIWTCKEAYLKGLGIGFAQPLSSFAMLERSERYWPEPELDAAPARWSLDCAADLPGYAVALAAPGTWQYVQSGFPSRR